jgi:hypothetical protein
VKKIQEINWLEKAHKPSTQQTELTPADTTHWEGQCCVRISYCNKHVSRRQPFFLSSRHALTVFPLFMVMLCLLAVNRSLRQGVTNVTQFPCGHCKALKQGRFCHVLQDAGEYSGLQSIREIKYRVWGSVGRGEGYCERNKSICASCTMLSLKAIYKKRCK